MKRLWRLLVSVRTALVLILALAATTLAGTLIAQAPMQVALGGDAYAQWVEAMRPRFGAWTDLLSAAGLFFVFRSWWFQALAGLLVLSVAACSIHRWDVIAREVLHPHVRIAAAMFERSGAVGAEASGGASGSAAALERALGARGYRVLAQREADATHLYADRARFARFGSVVAHAGLAVLLVAAFAGVRMGWSDDAFVVPEGSTRDVGIAGLAVHVDDFAVDHYASGEPKEYRSDVVLYRNGGEVARKTIRVNDPLERDGVRFYQSFFGPAAYLRVTDGGGSVLVEDGVALAWRLENGRPAGTLSLPVAGLTAYVVMPATDGTFDTLIAPGEVRLELYESGSGAPVAMGNVAQGRTVALAGLDFTFLRERRFTGLRVASEPTLPLIWGASTTFVLGIAVVFLFPYRRLWARTVARPDGGSRVALVTVGRRDEAFQRELAELADEAVRGGAADRKE